MNIRKSISSINWGHLFSDNYIDSQVSIFEECLFKNFVPNKYVVFDDKEPVWMDKSIKQWIKERDSCYSNYQSQGRLSSIKVRVFLEKNIENKDLCHHDEDYCYFCKSNIPVINLIVGSRNMINLPKTWVSKKLD